MLSRRDDKILYIFNSQEERRNCGGSSFIEIQFCELSFVTKINNLVSVSNISHWKNDFLYISDEKRVHERVRQYI